MLSYLIDLEVDLFFSVVLLVPNIFEVYAIWLMSVDSSNLYL